MFLKALEIQGFKSFPDRTRITVGKGITAVVGPNGSGKSNISDAIRWVLGETSAKQLRGGGKMENVIFGGTQQRGAMGFASVSLVVDNTDRRIDVDNDEVTIGRKYYRSGDSEYSVNGQNVRLKDIYELFLDTGLGRDGYSVIGQGRIAEIVGAKSNERREIFEEASGIAKYRYRKNEAERRLASAEENLVRLRDILGELEERVGPLERESKKAKQYLELAERRKGLEVTLWVDTVQKARDTVREQQRKIEIAGADYARAGREIEAIDAETESTRAEIEHLITEADRCNAEIRAITEEIAGADSRIAVLENDIAHNDATIASLKEEIGQSGLGREAIAAEVRGHGEGIAACERQAAAYAARTGELEALLEELQNRSAASGERRGVVTGRLNAMAARITDLKVAAAGAASSVEAAKKRLAAAESEGAANAALTRDLEEQKAETDAFLQDAVERLTRLENIKGGLTLKVESRRGALAQADENEQKLLRAIEAARQRIAMLKDLERNMDGFQSSVKAVMKAAANRRLRGITGPVSTILSVKPGYEVAIETALGFALQNIVVENETAAKAAMAFLRDERAGRATFLPLDTVKPGSFNGRLPEGAVLASSLVTYDEKYANIVSSLLGRIVVVDDINEASRTARALDYRNRVVTVDGQVVNAGGSFTGGSVSRSAGLFSRKQEIDELKKKVEALEKQRDAAEEKTDRAKAEVDALSAELTATESEAITAGGDKIRGEVESGRIAAALSQARAAGEMLSAERAQLAAQIAASEKAGADAAAEMEVLTRDSAALEEELRAISGSDDTFLETRTRLADELSDLKLKALAAQKDIESHRAAIAQLESRTDESDARARQLAANIETLTAQNAERAAQIETIRAAIAGSRNEIEKREEAKAGAVRRRMEKEGGITQQTARVRKITDEREALGREIARLTEQKEQKDAEYEQTVAKLWEEYELTLSAAQELCVPFESGAELRRQVSEVRGKIKALGNVNVSAIEEYAEVSRRYEFLRAQVGDVETSKAELQKLIAGLSDEMRAMFSESFAAINRNFGRIFAELFGGGTARLYLEDEADVLGSGISIEVAPPGKIIRNLSALSGGEQALVAISIYFAIFGVNPAPFCVLDEIEAALDDVNVTRFAQYLRRISSETQFIVITHRRGTMEEADVLYGVTMQEDGVSKVLKLDLEHVDASLVS
ncbi:chromosome segregation protein SMC [Ruthenibacterium lactatiformans]|jgi:chromosome segregation protein|uniref:chromosome segregation protein SMC n=1 Tax=Ruthenibacterium lactatiformans TaxID=1550024 RepID=UPI00196750D3|nr:chromosome segregation protein SMC [Ruthenibacterium lactatiformans]MBN3011308.1 chromosome segregation protein SMC [Ruthenibacterium lactatiformans]MBN3016158.1 chromosome segregation protein SMC [Ruthenibacterium lactatiformans]